MDTPIEMFCGKCGYKAFLNEPETTGTMDREARIALYRSEQNDDSTRKVCPRCSSDGKQVTLEIH